MLRVRSEKKAVESGSIGVVDSTTGTGLDPHPLALTEVDHPGERHHILAPVVVRRVRELDALVFLYKLSDDNVPDAVGTTGAAEEVGAGHGSHEIPGGGVVAVAHVDGHVVEQERLKVPGASGRQMTGVEVHSGAGRRTCCGQVYIRRGCAAHIDAFECISCLAAHGKFIFCFWYVQPLSRSKHVPRTCINYKSNSCFCDRNWLELHIDNL